MDKRLEKTLKEQVKIEEQLEALRSKLTDVKEKRIAFEKEELFKNFKETEISLEEYQMIVREAIYEYKGLNDTANAEEKKENSDNEEEN
jgi:hypothetical protein